MKVSFLAALSLAGCGDFHFADDFAAQKAAATPQDIQVFYSQNEDLTALFWKQKQTLSADIGQVEVGENDTFAAASAIAEPALSSDEALAFVVLAKGRVSFALRMQVREGVRNFEVPKTVDKVLGVSAGFTHDDSAVWVTPTDPFATFSGGGIARAFTAELRDATCAELLTSATTPHSETSGKVTLPAPPSLNDDGHYCVTMTSNAATFALPLQTVPLVREVPFAYAIPTIVSPSIVVPVWNFDEPDTDACTALLSVVGDALAAATSSISVSTSIVVNPINVAGDASCAASGAGFDLAIVQDEVGPLLGGEVPPTVLFVLGSNIDAPISDALLLSLQNGVAWAQSQSAMSAVAILGSDTLNGSYFDPVRTARWTYADDPELSTTLASLVTSVLPYQSYDLEPDTTLSLFVSPPSGFGFKVCASNVPLSLVDDNHTQDYFPLPSVPGTFNTSAFQPFVPAYAFAPGNVTAASEVCSRYCDRDSATAWWRTPACEGAR